MRDCAFIADASLTKSHYDPIGIYVHNVRCPTDLTENDQIIDDHKDKSNKNLVSSFNNYYLMSIFLKHF